MLIEKKSWNRFKKNVQYLASGPIRSILIRHLLNLVTKTTIRLLGHVALAHCSFFRVYQDVRKARNVVVVAVVVVVIMICQSC